MIVAAPVTVIVNGAIVPSAAPALLAGGRVMLPLTPVVVRLVSRVAYEPSGTAVRLERDRARLTVPVVRSAQGEAYVEARAVVAGFGGSAAFDARSRTLTIVLQATDAIAAPASEAPEPPPATLAPVSMPPPSTPRPIESTLPRPRRTAIPAVPSQPIAPPLGDRPTRPRR